jgi:hypothetical protein
MFVKYHDSDNCKAVYMAGNSSTLGLSIFLVNRSIKFEQGFVFLVMVGESLAGHRHTVHRPLVGNGGVEPRCSSAGCGGK